MTRPTAWLVASFLAWPLLAGATPRLLDLPGPDRIALQAADAARDGGGPDRFADPYDLALEPDDGPGWDRLPDGSHRWRLEVQSPGALSLNFGFRRFRLPWGAELRIEGARGPARVFTAADVQPHGELWTPVVLGETALVTLTLPPGERDGADLELARVGRGYRLFGEPDDQVAAKQGDCNVDVICPEGDPWRSEIRSVGVYTVRGAWTCSGALINDVAEDQKPYFLTAAHCRVDSLAAASVVLYWNFESPVCGDLAGGSLDHNQSGSAWRATYFATDMTLLELTAEPDTSWHVAWAGWDRSGATPPWTVGIHHPGTDEKAISFENDPLEIDAYLGREPVDDTHWRVVDWDRGTTEDGSSGSPLFDPQHRIVGQLHGGWAACGNDDSDWYGRFSVSWEGGGTPRTQLAHWLDPEGEAPLAVDTFDPRDPGGPGEGELPQGVLLLGPRGNPTTPGMSVLLEYELPRAAEVRLAIYDLRGRRVAVVEDGPRSSGTHLVPWSPRRAAAGVYVARLDALGERSSAKFTVMR